MAVSSVRFPSRSTATVCSVPEASPLIVAVSAAAPVIGTSSTPITRSPERRPAASAADPCTTSWTSAPERVAPSASCVPSAAVTPSAACWTAPCWRICWTTIVTVAAGIAKPRPMLPDCPSAPLARDAIEELMPITAPEASTRGPPELPGLIAASVWTADT